MNEQDQNRTRPTLREAATAIFVGFMLSLLLTVLFIDLKEGKIDVHSPKLYLLFSQVLFFIPAVVLIKRKRYDFLESFRIRLLDRRVVLATVLIGLSLTVLIDELDRLIGLFIKMPKEGEGSVMELLKVESVLDWMVLALAAVILAGFFEEALFRGILQKNLEEIMEPRNAILFASVCFALLHPSFWFIQIAIFSIVLGFVAWRADNILPGVIVHGINNAFTIALINLPDGSLDWYNQGNHVYPPAVAVAACVAYYAFRWFFRLTATQD
jgi:hypothetical protein